MREIPRALKRPQGGSDFELDRLVALCPRCHAQTDAPYQRGRLVVTPLGQGRFTCQPRDRQVGDPPIDGAVGGTRCRSTRAGFGFDFDRLVTLCPPGHT